MILTTQATRFQHELILLMGAEKIDFCNRSVHLFRYYVVTI